MTDIEYLKQSEVVRLVLDGKFTPDELDSAYRNLRKRVRQLEQIRTEQAVEIGNLLQRIQYETRCEE